MFVAETRTLNVMARTRGHSPYGARPPVPHRPWKTTTFVAGLRLSGTALRFVLDGPIDREAFQTCVDRLLVPELTSGDIEIMDTPQP